jgi:acetyltransferase-like isoleucine patch superfamily enzyme
MTNMNVGRVIKSLRNRSALAGQLLRGAATRLTLPGVLVGGKNLKVGHNVSLTVYGRLTLGEGVTLSDGCALEVGPGGHMVIASGTFVGRHSVIAAQEMVHLGARCLVAESCSIRDHDHHVDPEERLHEVLPVMSAVVIEENVWIGAGVRVLRGSHIGGGAVIAANAVVRGDIPARTVAAGIPARVIRSATALAIDLTIPRGAEKLPAPALGRESRLPAPGLSPGSPQVAGSAGPPPARR